MEPATMQELPEGWDVKFNDPPDAGANYSDFLRGHLMAIAARHGVPYEVLTGDLRDVSDRALRLILNEFRRIVEMWQWLYMIPKFCQPVREAYFDAAVLAGSIDVPGYADIRDEVTETLWVPQGWPYSHPVQDVDADIKAIRAGLASRSSVVLSNGDDPEQTDSEQAADNERADNLGLKYDSDGRYARYERGAKAPKGESDEP
jgi:lambda family phage portal protein